jgi:hypothetical protein
MNNFIREQAEQLVLPLKLDKDFIRDYFERATGKTVSLTITDNTTSILSVETKKDIVFVRLQNIFLKAGKDVLDEIAVFIKKRKGKTPLLWKFVKANNISIKKKRPRKFKIITHGKYYNLLDIFRSLNDVYFKGRISCHITWGTKCSRYFVKKRTLGSYDSQTNTIRINPVLDRKNIPGYFIEFIVYHEMLHAELGVKVKDGNRIVHTKEFRKKESLFADYERAIAKEKKGF